MNVLKQNTNIQGYSWSKRRGRNKRAIPQVFRRMRALRGGDGISRGLETAMILITAGGTGLLAGNMIKNDAALVNALNRFQQDGTVSMSVAASAYSTHKKDVKSEASIKDYYSGINTISGSVLIIQIVLFAAYAHTLLKRLVDYVERKAMGVQAEKPA